ncbi:hypothetical protein M2132_001886, partial [Dysgonomonas sp. PH5-45]|nr:hypothetical protein [Dysgonomonas sp. PH5-45]MDH6388438.1 hypothetical protein [Dysgonomonas sp. PH5-37]
AVISLATLPSLFLPAQVMIGIESTNDISKSQLFHIELVAINYAIPEFPESH